MSPPRSGNILMINNLTQWHGIGFTYANNKAMKYLKLLILCQIAALLTYAEHSQNGLNNTAEGSAQLTIYNHSANYKKDSILVICDRYDRSGAGVVYKVYHPQKNHTVTISGIPTGKYYVTIQWMGMHHERMEKVVKIKSGRCETIPVRLGEAQEYAPGHASIPVEHLDFSKLKVVTMK